MKNKTWKKWNNEDDEKLKILWENSTMDELLTNFPDRNYNSLMCRARILGVKSKSNRKRENGNISLLLNKDKIAFYTLGFLLADGSFSNKEISVSQKDIHKDFFFNFIKNMGGDVTKIKHRSKPIGGFNKKEYNSYYFRIGQQDVYNKLIDDIGIDNNKTYIPITNIEYFFDNELFPYFLIGLIDGDGSIWFSKTSPSIRIELHYNWKYVLEKISSFMFKSYGMKSNVNISNKGFSQLNFSAESIRWLYNLSNDIHSMRYKWDKLSEHVNKHQQ